MGSTDEHIDVSNKLFDADSIAPAASCETDMKGRPRGTNEAGRDLFCGSVGRV